jgi:hypothetical protein
MVDRYTKAVLTVIAGCLLVIAFRDISPVRAATAEAGPMHVIIDRITSFSIQPLRVICQNCR